MSQSLLNCFKSILLLCSFLAYATAEETENPSPTNQFSTSEKWIYGILTGVGLGLVGFFAAGLVVFFKNYTKYKFEGILKVLVAFAAGALIGDALIHLIPEAFSSEEGEEQVVSPKLLSFFACLGLFIFACLERLFLALGIGHSHGHGDNHVHSNPKDKQSDCKHSQQDEENNQIKERQDSNQENQIQTQNQNIIRPSVENINKLKMESPNEKCHHMSQTNDEKSKSDNSTSGQIDLTTGWKNKKAEGFLNQLGDFLHNIMDGIALGVAFSTSQKQTVATTIVAIFAHEIPQEMGNASILLNSNFSGKQAMICNGLVNFSAIIGIVIGIAVSSLNEQSEKIMNCFIAGNFLYIGATEMLPKLNEEKSHRVSLLQLFSLAVGFGVMFLILLAESEE